MMFNQKNHFVKLVLAAVASSLAQAHAGLRIVPTFDATVTGTPNAVDYIAAFNYAAQQFSAHFANDITVNIKVVLGGPVAAAVRLSRLRIPILRSEMPWSRIR